MLVLSVIEIQYLKLEKPDVRTAFLHGSLDDDVFMQQPEGFTWNQSLFYKEVFV